MHRGVYGRYRDVVPNERALYHLVPARWFNAQLPIGAGRDGYVTEDFHVLGGIETFRDLDKLLAHANEQLAERRGYFYVMQLDFDHPEAFRRDERRDARREKTEEKKSAGVREWRRRRERMARTRTARTRKPPRVRS